ncbi:hypothetical protein C5610_02990 [Idiomarina sp. OT37-5b]|uniref:hypothetical protein n=1 Tax=Idiomarina sp. OT37-5b TaxID=2100422 RepID=UPI000CFA0134|nr:hypothetical protein [Idiomarina sp. OT37-5b]AVJ55362.1 hypothetical protein C5610_02990 [Idiomarina sp. OT37-5b]
MTEDLSSLSLEKLLLKLKDEELSERECSVIMQCLPDKMSALMSNDEFTDEEKGNTIVSFQRAIEPHKQKFELEHKEAREALTKLSTGKKTIRNYQDIKPE